MKFCTDVLQHAKYSNSKFQLLTVIITNVTFA
jgi:hypothetical protein